MIQKTVIHNFTIAYEQNAAYGINYLRNDLDANESRVFFDQAHRHGSAEFEDDQDRQYTLLYQNGSYTLIRR